jgi:hypothetical protein
MIPAFVLVTLLTTRHPTPLRPGEWREIGGPIEGSTRADWRWGCFGQSTRRGGFGRGRGNGRRR